jgi:hypothetical protein
VFDPQKALSYQRALAVFTRIVDEPASVPGLLQNAAAQVSRITHIAFVQANYAKSELRALGIFAFRSLRTLRKSRRLPGSTTRLFRTLFSPERGMFGQIAPLLRQLFELPLDLNVWKCFGRPFAMLGHFFVVFYLTVAH